jgi:hypothetical protein
METTNNQGVNKRAFVSCGLFLCGLGLPFSGLMNHILAFGPPNVEKHIWMSVHNVLAVMFVFYAAFHISFNWKSLIKYFRNYSIRIFSKELVLASVLIFVMLFAAIFHSI